MRRRIGVLFKSRLILLTLCFCALFCTNTTMAASFKTLQPKLTKASAYNNGKVYLKWTKVNGAQKYEVYRAYINPSTGKATSWKKWTTTTKLYVSIKATGDYKYRVRAVKGSTRSKWSVAKRVFAAKGRITNVGFDGRHLNFRILITNSTKSKMGFMINRITGSQIKIYAVNKSSGKVVKTWNGDLIPAGGDMVYASVVNAGKSQSIYIQSTSMSAADYAKYKKYKFLVVSSFYPNPEVEPISTQMALSCTASAADSSIAAK